LFKNREDVSLQKKPLSLNYNEIISVSLILFSIIDILGNLPIVIDLKNRGVQIESGKASLIAMSIMLLFLVTGDKILGLFGVDVTSFSIAGAIIIFIIGMEMILGRDIIKNDPTSRTGTVVPIAFPLIAGAGTMTTIISLKANYDTVSIFIGIIINIILVYIVLRSSNYISKKIGRGGAQILRKVFGIILLAIAIKLFRENFFTFVPNN